MLPPCLHGGGWFVLSSHVLREGMDAQSTHGDMTMFKRNSLIQYKGGGYDGCFWEWNYAWFDARGHFHDIYSSGYKGCDTLDEVEGSVCQSPRRIRHLSLG